MWNEARSWKQHRHNGCFVAAFARLRLRAGDLFCENHNLGIRETRIAAGFGAFRDCESDYWDRGMGQANSPLRLSWEGCILESL